MSYGYDAGTYGKGRRTSMADPSGSTSWTYNVRGLVSGETKVIAGPGGGTFASAWLYDRADRTRTIAYPANNAGALGEGVTVGYDAAGRVKQVSGDYTYVGDTTYNALGQVTTRKLGSSGAPVLTRAGVGAGVGYWLSEAYDDYAHDSRNNPVLQCGVNSRWGLRWVILP